VTSDLQGLNGGLNTYGYVNGNPLSLIDPWGLEASFVRWKNTKRADDFFIYFLSYNNYTPDGLGVNKPLVYFAVYKARVLVNFEAECKEQCGKVFTVKGSRYFTKKGATNKIIDGQPPLGNTELWKKSRDDIMPMLNQQIHDQLNSAKIRLPNSLGYKICNQRYGD
jgi:uncharacterized protein RhaS with RHS repeats